MCNQQLRLRQLRNYRHHYNSHIKTFYVRSYVKTGNISNSRKLEKLVEFCGKGFERHWVPLIDHADTSLTVGGNGFGQTNLGLSSALGLGGDPTPHS